MNVQPKREGFVETPDDEKPPTPIAEPAAPPAPIDQGEVWPVRVKLLHKQVRNNRNEPVDELVFREPTAGDINRYGNPCRIGVDGEVIFDEVKMMRVIAALSGILLPNLEVMDPRDWNSCAYRLRSFFLPEVAAWQ
jgi:Phage tail assembly chaperone proteins, E, or 41 or 14